jgi:mannitol/fructose-specific phosphotransferase system IIA component (Ntr-type)
VDALPLGDGGPTAREEVLKAVFEREKVMSTGIGRGVALPHGKCEAVPGLLAAVGITKNPVPYEAIDGKPCRIFVLLVANPRTTHPHIQALATLSKILNDPARKAALETARSPADVLAALGIPAK